MGLTIDEIFALEMDNLKIKMPKCSQISILAFSLFSKEFFRVEILANN